MSYIFYIEYTQYIRLTSPRPSSACIINFFFSSSPEYEKIISGEGLPLVEDPEQRGDLIIDFNVEFPSYLSEASKKYVQKAFDVGLANRTDDDVGKNRGSRRIVLADKLYMRSDKLAQICRP